MIYVDLYLTVTFILSALAILLVIWAFFTGKKLYSVHIMKIFIVFILLSTCTAQDELEDDFVITDDKPIVLPEGIIDGTKILEDNAKKVIDYAFEDNAWRQSAYWFLYGDINLTNETNLTA